MAEQSNEAVGDNQQQAKTEFSLQRLYLKDLSFEAPQGAKAFTKQWKPKVNQDLSTKINRLENDHYEVVLHLTITVKDEEETLSMSSLVTTSMTDLLCSSVMSSLFA